MIGPRHRPNLRVRDAEIPEDLATGNTIGKLGNADGHTTHRGSRHVRPASDASKPAKVCRGLNIPSLKGNVNGQQRSHAPTHHVGRAVKGLMSPCQKHMRSQLLTSPQRSTEKSWAQLKRRKSPPRMSGRHARMPELAQAQAALQGLVRMRRQERQVPGEAHRLNRNHLLLRLHIRNHAQRVDQTVNSE